MSTMEWPKLRADLLLSRQGQDGHARFVVKDPVNNQFFHLKEADYFIAAQLDGMTPWEIIRQRTEEKFKVTLSQESLVNFVANLRQFKLLETAPSESPRRAKRRRLLGGLLYLRFKLFDPDALLTRMVGPMRFCFMPAFVACTAMTILWAVCLAVGNWDALQQDLARLWRWDALLLLWVTMCGITTAHEFAHGLTCKHFGGEVHELGFLLMYFQPAFYCNVSDVWLFPEKRKRVWVGFAGPFFELFLWACALLVWRVTDPETWLNYGALAVLATSGIKTLLNFNPLLKLDGYYLLSDLCEIPNLRRRAYSYIGNGIKRLFGIREAAAEITERERRIYLAYGLVSSALSFSVLGFAIVKFGGVLLANRQPEALAVAAGFLGLKIQRRFRRFLGKSSRSSDLDDFPNDETPREPNGAEEPMPAARNKKPRLSSKRRWVIIALIAIVLPSLFFGHMELRISAPFVLLPLQSVDVRAEVDGSIEEICVDEGDWVHTGDVIARLSDRENRTALSKTESDIAQMRSQLKLLQAGPRLEEIELARIGLLRAKERYEFANENLKRDSQLRQEQLISQKEFEASKYAVTDSEHEVSEMKQKLQALLAGSRPEEIEAIKAGIARLEVQRKYLQDQLVHVKVISPTAGVVATPSRELKEMLKQVVKEGDLIAKIHELKTVEVQTPVSERDIADIKVGQKVALKARSFPGHTFFGTVTSVATTVRGATPVQAASSAASTALPSSSGPAPAQTVLVTTRIANDGLLLKAGMTGVAKIYCGEHRPFDLLTRRLVRTVKVEFWSWW